MMSHARLRSTMPLIGVPTFYDTTLPGQMPPRFAMSRPYIDALEAAGAAVVLFPLGVTETTMRVLFERVDGLFLAGGGDVNPACYAAEMHPKTEGIDGLRDAAELTYARWALEADKPVFGVCRGTQTLNVAAGGTLVQDIPSVFPTAIRHQYYPDFPREHVAHEIATVGGVRLAGLLGSEARVNSFHHQAVERVADGFSVAARAEDGVIEAIERDSDTFTIGVQWHPESLVMTDPAMLRLFTAFVQASITRAA